MASGWRQDVVRNVSRMASGCVRMRQDGVRMTPGKCQASVRMASGWCQDGVRERQDSPIASETRQDASGWRQNGVRMASGCVKMASGKHHMCVRVEVQASGARQDESGCVRKASAKCQDSIRMASGWRQGGVKERQDSPMASETRQDASEWRQDGVRMASGCVRMRREGVRVASGRRQDNLASGWRQDDRIKSRKWCIRSISWRVRDPHNIHSSMLGFIGQHVLSTLYGQANAKMKMC